MPARLNAVRTGKPLQQSDEIKNIIVKSLQYLVHKKRIQLHAFAPIEIGVNNHLHLFWRPLPGQTLQSIKHSFLKHTAQEMKMYLQHLILHTYRSLK